MPGIATSWSADLLSGDWQVGAQGLAEGDDLGTAVILSLFTDRRAAPSDVPPGDPADRRGWWADTGAQEGPLGSRLWLLAREKRSEETRLRAIGYAREALAWLIADGIASSVEVEAEWRGLDQLALVVTVVRGEASPRTYRFDRLWRSIGG